MIINDLDGYYIVFDTKNWNTELDTLFIHSTKSLNNQTTKPQYYLFPEAPTVMTSEVTRILVPADFSRAEMIFSRLS